MPRKKEKKGDIAKYFIRKGGEVEARGGTTTDPSRMFHLNRMEGTGQGEAGPTHNTTQRDTTQHTTSQKSKDQTNQGYTHGNGDKTRDESAYDYGRTEGDRKGKRDARLGPQKSKSPQKATPSDDEVTWGTPTFPRSKEKEKLERGSGEASKHVPEEDGVASMGASWRAAEVWGDPTRTRVATRGGTPTERGGLVKTTPKRKDKTGKGQEEPTRRRKEREGLKILYLNAGKHERALEEVSRLHRADDIIILGETPLLDDQPIEIEGYATIAEEGRTDICAYIKEARQHMIEGAETSKGHIIITTRGGWKIVGIYSRGEEGIDTLPPTQTDTMIWMGDFNARHATWYDAGRKGRSSTDKKGRELLRWATRKGMREIGRKEHTRKQGTELPSKIDLIFTNAKAETYPPQEIANSDHSAITAKIEEWAGKEGTVNRKADYRKCDWERIKEKMGKAKRPTTGKEFQKIMDDAISNLPRKRGDGQNRLPIDLLQLRRETRKMARKKEKHEEYHVLRNQYREKLRDFVNSGVEKQLEEADETGVYQLSKRGKRKRVMQYLKREGKVYRKREELARCIAEHQGAGEKREEEEEERKDIGEVEEWEIQDAMRRSPANSANGADDAPLRMVQTANEAHPGALREIYTDILRRGKHPEIWKDVEVVPIPKAKKKTYTTPKSWRAIHLLRVVSKILERVVLRRLQDAEDKGDGKLGTTQFGSRRNRGTTDAMTALMRWKQETRKRGHYQSIIVADIEGGFDKVEPSMLRESPINKDYIPWILSWARNRTMRIRINGSTDNHTYTTNQGIPQGSPLSAYLFCAHIKRVMDGQIRDDGNTTRMVISYVDDAAICVSARDKRDLQGHAQEIWDEMKKEARKIGMDFAEEKTKTWHDHEAKWEIGKKEEKTRFLGYIISKPEIGKRTQEEDWTAHTAHWQTKGNQIYNIVRAMTQRTEGGIRTVPALRLLYACTKTMLHYGIEFWGHDEKQTKATDAYMYEALRRLFDIPKATPHRALSSEYALPPTQVQWEYIRQRLGERRKRHDPMKDIPWRKMRTEVEEAGSPMPWKIKSENQPKQPKRGETKEWKDIERIGREEIAIFTDGSMSKGKVEYGIVAYTRESLEQGGAEWEQAGSMENKNILDAEVWAIIQAMKATKQEHRKVRIFTDSISARDWIVEPKKEGALAYMWEEMCEATKPEREIEVAWVKGHRGNKGNERADALARKGGPTVDPWEGKSHAARSHEISEERNEAWKKWFNEKEHFYKRKPRRKLKHLRGLTRADTIAVFRMRSDKGWGKTAIGKEEDRERCKCGGKMSTDHIMSCNV